MKRTLAELYLDHKKWQEKTFIGQTRQGIINHLRRELDEIEKSPGDRSELADFFILGFGLCQVDGITDGHLLLDIIGSKHEINKLREWQPPDADGVCSHVK